MTRLVRTSSIWPTQIERVFSDLMNPRLNWPASVHDTINRAAPVDIHEGDNAYTIRMDLPGVKKENLGISLEDGRLSIRGERRSEENGQLGRCTCQERFNGVIERSFTLGRQIDSEKIEAKLTDGVLELTLPKRPEVTPKEIPIK